MQSFVKENMFQVKIIKKLDLNESKKANFYHLTLAANIFLFFYHSLIFLFDISFSLSHTHIVYLTLYLYILYLLCPKIAMFELGNEPYKGPSKTYDLDFWEKILSFIFEKSENKGKSRNDKKKRKILFKVNMIKVNIF